MKAKQEARKLLARLRKERAKPADKQRKPQANKQR